MPTAFRDHYFQPWSLIEPGFFALALILILQNRRLWLAALVLVATLNRETAIFIPALYLAARWGEGRAHWAWAGMYFVVWAAVFVGARQILGSAPHVITFPWYNLTPHALASTLLNVPLFLGPVPVFAILGYPLSERFLQRAAWIVPLYLLCVYVFGYWMEVRLLMSMYALVIPLAWRWLTSFDELPAAPSAGLANGIPPEVTTEAPGGTSR